MVGVVDGIYHRLYMYLIGDERFCDVQYIVFTLTGLCSRAPTFSLTLGSPSADVNDGHYSPPETTSVIRQRSLW